MAGKTLILADTNFLVECFKNKVDITTELDRICHFQYGLAIVDLTIRELEQLKNDPKTRVAALLARTVTKNLPILDSTGLGKRLDDVLVKLAQREKAIIATQDKELKKRLPGPVIVLRQNKYLALINHNL